MTYSDLPGLTYHDLLCLPTGLATAGHSNKILQAFLATNSPHMMSVKTDLIFIIIAAHSFNPFELHQHHYIP